MRTNLSWTELETVKDQPEVGFEIGLTGSLSDKWFLSADIPILMQTAKMEIVREAPECLLDLEQLLSVRQACRQFRYYLPRRKSYEKSQI